MFQFSYLLLINSRSKSTNSVKNSPMILCMWCLSRLYSLDEEQRLNHLKNDFTRLSWFNCINGTISFIGVFTEVRLSTSDSPALSCNELPSLSFGCCSSRLPSNTIPMWSLMNGIFHWGDGGQDSAGNGGGRQWRSWWGDAAWESAAQHAAVTTATVARRPTAGAGGRQQRGPIRDPGRGAIMKSGRGLKWVN